MTFLTRLGLFPLASLKHSGQKQLDPSLSTRRNPAGSWAKTGGAGSRDTCGDGEHTSWTDHQRPVGSGSLLQTAASHSPCLGDIKVNLNVFGPGSGLSHLFVRRTGRQKHAALGSPSWSGGTQRLPPTWRGAGSGSARLGPAQQAAASQKPHTAPMEPALAGPTPRALGH